MILQDLAVQIQEICNTHQLQVQYQHIAGIENIDAGELSRRTTNSLYEAIIPKPTFDRIQRNWGRLNCSETESTTTNVLEFQSGSELSSNRCPSTVMEESRLVLFYPVETNPSHITQDQNRLNT